MRLSFALVSVLLLPSVSFAQTEEMIEAVKKKLANTQTAKWIFALEAPNGGFYLAPPEGKGDTKPVPSLRATNGAVRALKYLGYPLLKKEREKHTAFVLSCYDPNTGAFAEMGGKPDVTITSIGVMAAVELGIPKKDFIKAMTYLKENAKTFEEVRIAAAAVDAWDVVYCPFKLDKWMDIADAYGEEQTKAIKDAKDGGARILGSLVAFYIRLGRNTFGPSVTGVRADMNRLAGELLRKGQRDDGGFGKAGEKASDIETTYRVMRAFKLTTEKPKDVKKLRAFVDSHYNEDGGYAIKPGEKSSMSGVYYCVIVSKWLDEMEGK